MSGSIAQFKSNFKTDLARPNRFDVDIPVPLVLAPYLSTSRNLKFRCENAEIPGKTLATTQRKIGSAPVEKQPYQTNYTETELTFMVSDDMRERIFFEGWFEAINSTTNYNFKYKSDYAVDISINQYNLANELSYNVVLREAYPIAMNQMDLDWSADGYHKLAVTFAFTEWYNNTSSAIGKNIISQALSGLSEDFTKALIS